ncbi:hypothetical protein HaLaN_17887 [Haematococcus lacustris]|uniref:Uncharacterized protein n=1 Tax=Haematococcus lacustris TaxID=44745 RepID=A0A699ZHV4_HAELA|nr:hypothetical protein HaLaN_17887 [Haematococcus lacustris]
MTWMNRRRVGVTVFLEVSRAKGASRSLGLHGAGKINQAACSPGLGTPCPWLAELPALATSKAPAGATCSPQCAECFNAALQSLSSMVVVPACLWQPCLCPMWAG